MKTSYWGKVQQEHKYTRGVTFVSTAGHGGIMVSLAYAQKHLSIAAQKEGAFFGGYLCYEEDSLIDIIFLELPFTRADRHTTQGLINSLSLYHADYLIKAGYTPEPLAYKRFLARAEDYKRRQEGCPDLIVSAIGLTDSVCKVTTADQKEHFVTLESYQARHTREMNNLSDCVLVEVYQPSL